MGSDFAVKLARQESAIIRKIKGVGSSLTPEEVEALSSVEQGLLNDALEETSLNWVLLDTSNNLSRSFNIITNIHSILSQLSYGTCEIYNFDAEALLTPVEYPGLTEL